MVKAVIFNMNGVLLNSTPFIWKARDIYLEKYGVQINDGEISELLGKSLRDQLAIINRRHNLNIDYNDFSKKTREIQLELMDGMKPSEGVGALIDDLLKNDVKIAIASLNLKKFILEDLKIIGLKDKFEVITSVEEVENHKPHPEILLKTAEKLKVVPGNCIVIDDGIDGLEAAKRAGMKSIALATKFHKKDDLNQNADLVIHSLNELNWGKIKQL